MESVKCALCGGDKVESIFVNRRDKYHVKLYHCRNEPAVVVMCVRCGLAYHNPRLDVEEVHQIYAEHYKPDTPSEEFLFQKHKEALERVQWLMNRFTKPNRSPSMLEIGCCEGSFLLKLKKLGWKIYGVDPTESHARFGREEWGLEIETGMFRESTFSNESFDLIGFFHVFEHIHDPRGFLKLVSQRLKPDGTVYLEVPNLYRPRDNLYRHFFNSTHLYFYTPATLGLILRLEGFEVFVLEEVSGNIRALAKWVENQERPVDLKEPLEDFGAMRRLIRRHQLRWMLTAEWKEKLKGLLFHLFGDTLSSTIVERFRRWFPFLRNRAQSKPQSSR